MRSFGNRIELILKQIHRYGPFSVLADIGSDHAYVAVEALRRKDTLNAIASDINEGPLERGRKNAQRVGVPVSFCLSDGFDSFPEILPDCICICGMGGELISSIIERGFSYTSHSLLFLQPMTAHDDLRRYLWAKGFHIAEESYTVEGTKPYVLMTVRYTGVPESYTYPDLFLGKERPGNAEFITYVSKASLQCKKRQKGLLARGENSLPEDQLLEECLRITSGGNEIPTNS